MMITCSLLRSLYQLEFIFNAAEGLSAIRAGRVQINGVVQKDPTLPVRDEDEVTYLKTTKKLVGVKESLLSEMLQLDGLVPTINALREAIAFHVRQDVPLYRENATPVPLHLEEVPQETLEGYVKAMSAFDGEPLVVVDRLGLPPVSSGNIPPQTKQEMEDATWGIHPRG